MKIFKIKGSRQFDEIVPRKLLDLYNSKAAVGIIRRSGDSQKDNFSEAVQQQNILQHANRHGLSLAAIFSIIESAKSSEDRIIFQKITAWAERNQIKNWIYNTPDREARNLTDVESSMKRVRAGEIIIHYALDNRILDDKMLPTDYLQRGLVGVFDSHYSLELRHKSAQGIRAKAESGEFPGTIPPLGYEHEKFKNSAGFEKRRGTRIVPAKDYSKVRLVQREFELRAEGLSYTSVREAIIKEGLVPVSEIQKYRHTSIQRRVENKFYWGFFDWNGKEYKGNHELIIPKRILDKVKQFSGLKAEYTKVSGSAFPNGWLTCADTNCGCTVISDPKKKTIKATGEVKTYHYYRCTNGKKVHTNLKGMHVSETQIWNQLSSAVQQISIPEDWAKQLTSALNKTKIQVQNAIKADIENYRLAIESLQGKEDRLYDRLDRGEIDRDVYNTQRKRLQAEQIEFTNKMEDSQLKITDAGMETAQSILELAINAELLWKTRSPEERKEFLDVILSNQKLDGLTIRYELKKPFKTLSEMKGDMNWRRGF